MLNPIQLRTLQECVHTGSFAEAARSLGYTPSAISQQIGQLERTVGASLFERAAHSVRPTAIAITLANRCGSALDTLQAVETDIRAIVAGYTGTLRLASFASANATLVPAALAAFAERRPHVEIHLEEGEPDETLQLVTDGEVDCAVAFGYDLAPLAWPPRLRHKELLADTLSLVLPVGHPGVTELSELRGEPWICTRQGTGAARTLEHLAAEAGFAPQIRFRSNDYGVIRELVAGGFGVALMPTLTLRGAGIQSTPIVAESAVRRISVLYRPWNENPLLSTALECLANATARWAEQGPSC